MPKRVELRWASSFPSATFLGCGLGLVGALCWILCLGLHAAHAAAPPECRNYVLVFSEDFNTLDLGTADGPGASQPHKWYEGVWFSHEHAPLDRFTIGNSVLSLTWKRGQQEPDSSISTFSRPNRLYHAWRYGYFEARMKWKPIPGAWPAFWLISVPPELDGPPRQTGEIDIFEGQGDEPHSFFGTIHRWRGSRQLASSKARNRFSLPYNTDFSAFHTYGLLWVPGQVTWYFDGVPLHSERTYEDFDKENFLMILGMQEGSDWKSGDLAGVTAENLTLNLDWVRVWQTKDRAAAGTP